MFNNHSVVIDRSTEMELYPTGVHLGDNSLSSPSSQRWYTSSTLHTSMHKNNWNYCNADSWNYNVSVEKTKNNLSILTTQVWKCDSHNDRERRKWNKCNLRLDFSILKFSLFRFQWNLSDSNHANWIFEIPNRIFETPNRIFEIPNRIFEIPIRIFQNRVQFWAKYPQQQGQQSRYKYLPSKLSRSKKSWNLLVAVFTYSVAFSQEN